MLWWSKRPSVYIYKSYEAGHPSISRCVLILSLELFHLIFMHLNFHPVSSPLLATVSISQFLHSPNLLVLSPPFSRSSLRCQPPGLLDQRAFLWDHLERPVEVEKEKGRGRTQKGGGGEEGRSERLAESVGQGGVRRDSRKEVFLSRSTAAQSHTQYFPLAGTHFALTHTSAYSHACYLTAARTTAFDPRGFLGICIRDDSSTSTKNIRLKVKCSAYEHNTGSQMSFEPTTLWSRCCSMGRASCRIRQDSLCLTLFTDAQLCLSVPQRA